MNATKRAASIDDLRKLAKRRLPKFPFDFIDGGAETETNLALNTQAFQDIKLCPRYLVDCSELSLETKIFGATYSVPFGMAPVGFLNMAWPGADLMLARLAGREKMPHLAATTASTSLEDIAEAADGFAWFQLFVSRVKEQTEGLLVRAEAAGCEVLVVTVDVPQPGKRDRDVRNGLQLPFVPTPRQLVDLALHPHWSLSTLLNGTPKFGNFVSGGSGGGKVATLAEAQNQMISNEFTWDDLRRLRDRWKGELVLKGLLHPEDATRAVSAGCDGIIVSNHGGRQVDYGPASITALPDIVEATAAAIPVFLDSGIRRGSDIVRAKALGADFVFAGRAFAYGAAAGGELGVSRAFEILKSELSHTLGQIGQPDFADIGAHNLFAV